KYVSNVVGTDGANGSWYGPAAMAFVNFIDKFTDFVSEASAPLEQYKPVLNSAATQLSGHQHAINTYLETKNQGRYYTDQNKNFIDKEAVKILNSLANDYVTDNDNLKALAATPNDQGNKNDGDGNKNDGDGNKNNSDGNKNNSDGNKNNSDGNKNNSD